MKRAGVLLLLAFASWAVFIICSRLINPFTAVAQSGGCPTQASKTTQQWPAGTTVYYDVSGLNSAEKTAFVGADGNGGAFAAWNAENQANGSNVNFQPASSSNPATYVITDTQGASAPGTTTPCSPTASQAAQSCPGVSTSNPANQVSGVTVINQNATIPAGSPQSGSQVIQPSAANYATFLLSLALHEIGHTMGLGDQSTQCGSNDTSNTSGTVMGQYCGINDSGNGMASSFSQGCDDQYIKSCGGNAPVCADETNGTCAGDPGVWSCAGHNCVEDPSCTYPDLATCDDDQWTCHDGEDCPDSDASDYCSYDPSDAQCDDSTGDWTCATPPGCDPGCDPGCGGSGGGGGGCALGCCDPENCDCEFGNDPSCEEFDSRKTGNPILDSMSVPIFGGMMIAPFMFGYLRRNRRDIEKSVSGK